MEDNEKMEKRVQDYTQEILDTIRSNSSPAVMGSRLEDYHENDLADVLPLLTVPERCKLYRILDTDMLSDIFEYAESDNVAEYLEEMDVKKAASILSKMETDALAEVLQKLDKAKKKLLIELLDPEVRHDIEMIASFDEDEIGSRMTTNCIIIREDLNVKQAMSSLIDQAAKNDNISTIFVVNAQQKFYGAIDLKNLIIARRDETLEDLTVTSYPYVYAEEPINECIEELKDYSEDSIPVLDNDNRLLGVITSSNIIDLVDDEMGEHYAMFAGLTAEEDLKEPLKDSMKKRLPWLIILLGLGMLVSSVVGIFEQVVTTLPIIMTFQSLILDMAGNVGTQSLAVTIPDRKTEITACFQGNAHRFLQWSSAWCSVLCCHRTFHLLIQGKDHDVRIFRFRLHRHRTAAGNADFQCRRHLHSAVLQKDPHRSGGCFRSAHHDGQRPCRCRYILWPELAVPDRDAASRRLIF